MSAESKILAVDDDVNMAQTLRDIFTMHGHPTDTAFSGPEALEMLAAGEYACVLSDIRMPGMDGVALYRRIREAHPTLPVVLMTAYTSDSRIREGLDAGVLATLGKPLDLKMLLSFLDSLRRERSVLVVDDDPVFSRFIGHVLREHGYAVTCCDDPGAVMGLVEAAGQVMLLDLRLGDANGLDVLHDLRARHPALPVVLVTGHRAEMEATVTEALELGACTCFYKPFELDELLATLDEICTHELGRLLGRPPPAKGVACHG